MGYYNYQAGLIVRHLNQEGRWNNHNRKCRDFIIKAVDILRPSKITVLGSGWLLEFPVAEIAERTGKLILADIVHPPEVINQTADIKNIELLESDLTGGLIEEVWKKTSGCIFFNRLKFVSEICIPDFDMPDPGLVISLNLLTQLEILPVKLLRRKTLLTEESFVQFSRAVQEKHIEFLERHSSVLISDTAELIIDKKGNKTERATLKTTLPVGKLKDEWIWDFDLKGRDYNQKRSVFRMTAIMF